MAKSFYELEIWKNGFKLLLEVYKITAKYPKEEKYDLTSQTRRAANSIIANIAEAHGRFFFADKIRVLYQSRGELEETRSHLIAGFKLKYISKEVFLKTFREYEGLSKGISSYIESLKKQKTNL